MGSNGWYHNLASLNSVKQNIWTLVSSTKWCVVIQSLVWSRWASASSSDFPENSGLKWDQFRCTSCCAGCAGCCGACHSGGSAGSEGGIRCWHPAVAVLAVPCFALCFTMLSCLQAILYCLLLIIFNLFNHFVFLP